MLHAYNVEADFAVKTVRPINRAKTKERLSKARESIAKIGAALHIVISADYHQLRLDEIDLTADYRMKVGERRRSSAPTAGGSAERGLREITHALERSRHAGVDCSQARTEVFGARATIALAPLRRGTPDHSKVSAPPDDLRLFRRSTARDARSRRLPGGDTPPPGHLGQPPRSRPKSDETTRLTSRRVARRCAAGGSSRRAP
ncbi:MULTISPECIES: DUF4041 domain-containing protein [Nocardioides]|uniref:DUF4041 domain-containing protein n=1 Tax=Nocardioides vastitatis TaxID=2568655 RepID=A0ABW0ZFK1_9ACTN|nr:DUF4041 domain-containing protein [Nocardioides sp.]